MVTGESCSALVEHFDGRLEIVRWMKVRAFDPLTREFAPSRPNDQRALIRFMFDNVMKIAIVTDAWLPQTNAWSAPCWRSNASWRVWAIR